MPPREVSPGRRKKRSTKRGDSRKLRAKRQKTKEKMELKRRIKWNTGGAFGNGKRNTPTTPGLAPAP